MGKSILKKIIIGLFAIVMMAAPVDVSAASVFTETPQYVSITEAADSARDEFKNHETLIKVYIKSTKKDPEGVYYDFRDEVMKDTDKGDEGDYIYWSIDSQLPRYTYRPVRIGNEIYYYYNFQITLKYFTTLEQEKQVDEKVKEIINSFRFNNKTTDYEKVKTIYDYVCNNVEYANETTNNIIYTAWSALFNKQAVCQGYSQLMYRMLKEVGISCRIIPGYGNNNQIKHGWNIVKVGEYYYNVDATWDSQNIQAGLKYEYFLKADNFNSHTRMSNYNTEEFYAQYPMAKTDYVLPTVSKELSFDLIKPKFKSVTRKKVKLTKVAGAYKYQIKYSTAKKFTKYTKTVNTKKTTYKFKKLKKKKAYYVKFRAYKYVDKKKIYTRWSNIKKIKKK